MTRPARPVSAAAEMRRQAGFTLIEMTVVLVILGLAVGVAVGRGPQRSPALAVRMAAGTLAQGLRSARAQAIATDAPVLVAIDPVRHLYAVDNHAPAAFAHDLPVALEPPMLPGPGQTRVIRFGPDGSATGGRIVIGTGTRRTAVTIEWLTGAVTVADAG